jgi:hypothetical protein
MMKHASALKLALELMHQPSLARLIRSRLLPADVTFLLRIASGDEIAIRQAAEMSGRSRDVVREAADFFIEQILLYRGANSYRVLGTTARAPYSELRRNMALLLKWLHPDSDRRNHRAVLASRVTCAWDDLKTQERRAAYDRMQHESQPKASGHSRRSGGRAASIRTGRNPGWNKAARHGWGHTKPHGGHELWLWSWQIYLERGKSRLRQMLSHLFHRGTT